jgi:hypothetical protein
LALYLGVYSRRDRPKGFGEDEKKFSYEIMSANLEAQTSTPQEVQEVIAQL